jgi:hypothetical protein
MKNRTYAQLYHTLNSSWDHKQHKLVDCDPYLREACGSDGVFTLDGRLSIDNLIESTKNRIKILKNICEYTGFEIRRGNLNNYKTLCKLRTI